MERQTAPVTDETPLAAGPRGPADPVTGAGGGPTGVSTGLPAPSVSFFLIALGRRARESVDTRLHEQGLAYHHLSALGHLQRQPGLSYSELARRAHVTVQSMQTTVSHLERHDLVERGPTTTQGRRADLQLTERGREVLGLAQEAFRAADETLLAGVAPEERALLESALLRMFAASGSR